MFELEPFGLLSLGVVEDIVDDAGWILFIDGGVIAETVLVGGFAEVLGRGGLLLVGAGGGGHPLFHPGRTLFHPAVLLQDLVVYVLVVRLTLLLCHCRLCRRSLLLALLVDVVVHRYVDDVAGYVVDLLLFYLLSRLLSVAFLLRWHCCLVDFLYTASSEDLLGLDNGGRELGDELFVGEGVFELGGDVEGDDHLLVAVDQVSPLDFITLLLVWLILNEKLETVLRVEDVIHFAILGVQEGVGHHLLLQTTPLLSHTLPPRGELTPRLLLESILEEGQLLEEGGPDLEVRSAGVDVLETLVERPAELEHQVAHHYATTPALSLLGVDETTLPLGSGLLDELVDLVDLLVLLVEQHFLVALLPVEREVLDADGLPEVGYLVPGAVDDVRDLVGDQKLQVLKGGN